MHVKMPSVYVLGDSGMRDWEEGRGRTLLKSVEFTDEGCWLRMMGLQPNGTSRNKFGTDRLEYAHVVAYSEWVAPIPRGQKVFHLCQNKNCINPWHLCLPGDPEADRLRFERSLERYGDCFVWMGYVMPSGHGQINIGGRAVLTHRYAWELSNGPIPDGLGVCHHCDNPPCCNIDHLFLGDQEKNLADMAWKERSGNSKLTATLACKLREEYARGGITLQKLAEEFNISKRTALDTVHGKKWLHAGGPILPPLGNNGWTRRNLRYG